jgi:hypothetical protein
MPCTGALAQSSRDGDLSYTFLEADYLNLDVDVADDDESLLEDFDDGGGWAINGSFAFTPNFFAFAGYSVTDSDVTFVDADEVLLSSSQDVKRLNVGLGVNFGVNVPVVGESDVVLSGAYTDIDFDDFDFGGSDDPDLDDLNDDSSDGYFLDARLRSQLVSWAEASLGVRYTDIEDADDFSVVGNVLLEINQNFGVNLEFDAADDVGYYLVGLRYSFARF